jgi:hypothetical protein
MTGSLYTIVSVADVPDQAAEVGMDPEPHSSMTRAAVSAETSSMTSSTVTSSTRRPRSVGATRKIRSNAELISRVGA